ncbi:MAG TPA: peptide deformylase, partial [Polyangiaceae bacterium]|nr:peptide deformylase [Polyangiaceae bacterium]
ILHYPDKRLRDPGKRVEKVTPEIQSLIDDMAETMYAAPGCGLAAPQIGVPLRIFVIDTADDDEPSRLTVFINPELVAKVGETVWEEGCLSFPGVHEEIKRAERVGVRALDREGKPFELEVDGLFAVAVQHEHDHLEGVLMIDHVGALKRRLIHRKMQKREAEARP